MSRRYRSHEVTLIDAVFDLAWANPGVGTILCVGLMLIGQFVTSIEYSPAIGWTFVCPMIGMVLTLTGAAGLLVGAIAILCDLFFGRK
jgi:hypothetical protein